MKIAQLKRMIDVYGDVKISNIIKSIGKPFKCPKCEGDGSLQHRYNAYPSGLPDSGWVEDWRFRTVNCDICDGHGYTKDEKKPIVKTEIIGYE